MPFREVLTLSSERLGPSHATTRWALRDLGDVLYRAGWHDEALVVVTQREQAEAQVLPEGHRERERPKLDRGCLYTQMDREIQSVRTSPDRA